MAILNKANIFGNIRPQPSSGFILLSCSVDLLVKSHGERHTKKLGTQTVNFSHVTVVTCVKFNCIYLYDQHTHGDGSQEVLFVIQPILHFLITTLREQI